MMKLCLRTIIERVLQSNAAAFFYTPGGYSYFAESFESSVVLSDTNDCDIFFRTIEEKTKEEYTTVLLMNYEAGYLLNSSYFTSYRDVHNQVGKALFLKTEKFIAIDFDNFDFSKINTAIKNPRYSLKNLQILISSDDYKENLKHVHEYIAKGETYQVNLTLEASFQLTGDIVDFISAMIYSQSARYTSIIKDDERLILSFSPEMFFKIAEGKIIARPMKGTAPRGISITEDEEIRTRLLASEKERAENIMIVDLLRNDIGRLSKIGSVEVNELFTIEKYETVFQMVSEVHGTLRSDVSLQEIFRSVFPCGSVTGAPKLRTMEIIQELEKRQRGIYCGAIGFLNSSVAVFSVPIRTVECSLNSGNARIGIGSGIVWDSNTDAERTESLTKLSFLTNPIPWFEIFETIGVNNGSLLYYEEHIARLLKTADYFLFFVKENSVREAINKELQKIPGKGNYAIRVKADKWGNITSTHFAVAPSAQSTKVLISARRISSTDRFRRFKTTLRELYDNELEMAKKNGYFEVLFLNEKEELAEGAITNIVLLLSGSYYTPPLDAGILDGIAREHFIKTNKVTTKTLTLHDLQKAEKILLMNSVRGIIEIQADAIIYPS